MTKEMISFAIVGDEQVVDEIPLAEINTVEYILDDTNRADESVLSLQELEKARRFQFAMQITTVKGGHNSGRTYCLQVSDYFKLVQRKNSSSDVLITGIVVENRILHGILMMMSIRPPPRPSAISSFPTSSRWLGRPAKWRRPRPASRRARTASARCPARADSPAPYAPRNEHHTILAHRPRSSDASRVWGGIAQSEQRDKARAGRTRDSGRADGRQGAWAETRRE